MCHEIVPKTPPVVWKEIEFQKSEFESKIKLEINICFDFKLVIDINLGPKFW